MIAIALILLAGENANAQKDNISSSIGYGVGSAFKYLPMSNKDLNATNFCAKLLQQKGIDDKNMAYKACLQAANK